MQRERTRAGRTRTRRVVVASVVIAMGCVCGAAGAEPAAVAQPAPAIGTSSIAEKLFLEGKTLMQERQYPRACEKFKASYDLDRTATGTLLNLALCHEQVNKPATAWAEFRQVAAESAGRRDDRVTLAREHEAKLAPILSQVQITVLPAARIDGLVVQIDKGPAIGEAAWGTDVPIDPGKHVIEASAPGKRPWSAVIEVGSVSDRQSVTVTPLAAAPLATAPRSDGAAEREAAAARTRRLLGFTLGGVGLVAAGVGVAFGAIAKSNDDDATSACPRDLCANSSDRDDARSSLSAANTYATLSTVTVGSGLALLVTGAVLVLTARPTPAASRASVSSLRVAPVGLLNGGGGLVVVGEL